MNLYSITNVHEPSTTELLEYSVTEYLREGLLSAGAFLNVTSGTLLATPRPGVPPRTEYQSPRSNWVYESGSYYSPAPVLVSGVYVNGTFRPFGATCVPNYPAGSVAFSPPLSGTPTVVANYACRTVQVYNPRTSPWYYRLQRDSYDPAQAGSGTWSPDGRNRVQLPAVFCQAMPEVGRFEGHELGSLKRVHRQSVLFEIFAEHPGDRDRLHDLLVSQWQTRFDGVDQRQILRNNRQALSAAGNVNPGGLGDYTAQAGTYPWARICVKDVQSTAGESFSRERAATANDPPRLYTAVVRWVAESELPHGA